MKTITLQEDGSLKHLWLAEIHPVIPNDAIEVSDEVYEALGASRGTKKYDAATQTAINIGGKTDDQIQTDFMRGTKLLEIKGLFLTDSKAPVTVNGIEYNGGQDSASALYLKAMTLELESATNGTIYDINNTAHTLSIADIKDVIVGISNAYETQYELYQTKKASVIACGTVACLNAI